MYLVHTELNHASGAPLTAAAAHAVAQADGVEHATVHPDARPHPVLALYTRARSAADAASVATQAWHAAAARERWEDWTIISIRAYQIGPAAEDRHPL
ncbi:hypothetical protein [Streptomyces sp. NPDC021562]|uniref:hypothetical protein n=1 Tax=Streptomyces sp. NPDC021562 TaxID=3155121 RepID=UPI0010500D92